jgi:hypothetical protein
MTDFLTGKYDDDLADELREKAMRQRWADEDLVYRNAYLEAEARRYDADNRRRVAVLSAARSLYEKRLGGAIGLNWHDAHPNTVTYWRDAAEKAIAEYEKVNVEPTSTPRGHIIHG